MAFMNDSGFMYALIDGLTTNVFGAPFLTFLFIMLILISSAIAFRMPIDYTVLFILPLGLAFMAYSGQFIPIGGALLIYTGLIIAKNLWFK